MYKRQFYHSADVPRTVLSTYKFGMLGAGMGQALGAAVAAPDQRVCVLIGDGAFGMHPTEVESAVRLGLPIVFVVLVDGAWGMVKMSQQIQAHPIATVARKMLTSTNLPADQIVYADFAPCRYDLVGEAIFGATGAAVTASMSNADLRTLLTIDPAATAGQVAAMLRADERLRSIGVQIVDVRLGLVRPDPDVEKALQTPAREVIQQEADRATFERRAVAVEREAAIGENELANQIELARRREQFIAQEGTNARRKAEEAAAAGVIATDAEARRTLALAQAQAEAERARGAAAADAEKARLTAYDGVSQDVRMALVLQEVAAHLPDIDQLVVTPELVSSLLGRLAGAGAGVGSAAQEVKA